MMSATKRALDTRVEEYLKFVNPYSMRREAMVTNPRTAAVAAAIRAQLDNPATNPPLSNSWGYYVVFHEGC